MTVMQTVVEAVQSAIVEAASEAVTTPVTSESVSVEQVVPQGTQVQQTVWTLQATIAAATADDAEAASKATNSAVASGAFGNSLRPALGSVDTPEVAVTAMEVQAHDGSLVAVLPVEGGAGSDSSSSGSSAGTDSGNDDGSASSSSSSSSSDGADSAGANSQLGGGGDAGTGEGEGILGMGLDDQRFVLVALAGFAVFCVVLTCLCCIAYRCSARKRSSSSKQRKASVTRVVPVKEGSMRTARMKNLCGPGSARGHDAMMVGSGAGVSSYDSSFRSHQREEAGQYHQQHHRQVISEAWSRHGKQDMRSARPHKVSTSGRGRAEMRVQEVNLSNGSVGASTLSASSFNTAHSSSGGSDAFIVNHGGELELHGPSRASSFRDGKRSRHNQQRERQQQHHQQHERQSRPAHVERPALRHVDTWTGGASHTRNARGGAAAAGRDDRSRLSRSFYR